MKRQEKEVQADETTTHENICGLGENGASMPRVARAERESKHEDVSERKQRLIAQKLPNQVVECCLL